MLYNNPNALEQSQLISELKGILVSGDWNRYLANWIFTVSAGRHADGISKVFGEMTLIVEPTL